ncbi:SDR family oxidoreductase [Knoellia locipacati]|uniref:Ketoacyl reductase n=1 Tax=Knoellia locipacati TaxID=882824 RepID=A0A512SYQ0_9MICO|nr:SDR family NAD(P)-dependent oxidoreductase [Knoellia locipacati]GEQ13062.1 ketoacyl reductase [Knoellia locipacati]
MTRPVALVAGASRGLGLLISAELVARGHTVHGCARDRAELDRAADLIARGEVGAVRGTGGRPAAGAVTRGGFVGHVCDVTDAEAVSTWVEEVVASEGSLDVAIHVAGIIQVGPVESTTLGHFRAAIDTMLLGPVHLCLAVLPTMLDAGAGRIGVVSSVGGVVSVPHLLPYSVAKFGAVGLTEGLHAELSGTGVTATTIVPGLMRTGGHLHAQFVGDAPKDYAWFAPGASLPLLSVSAERAARRIVDGVLAGRSQVELTPVTWVGRWVHGLFPGTTSRLLGLVARALPRGDDRAPSMSATAGHVDGAQARRMLGSRVVDGVSVLGDRAARRLNGTGSRDL